MREAQTGWTIWRGRERRAVFSGGALSAYELQGVIMTQETRDIVPIGTIRNRILEIRGPKAIIDADLAAFYGVETKRLNEQVKRNSDRFPEDFRFEFTEREKEEVVANCDHLGNLKYSRTLPYAFTEHAVIMAASVLNTRRAIEMSVLIVRAFVALRQSAMEYRDIVRRISDLEDRTADHDEALASVIRALRALAEPGPVPERRRIGF